MTDSARRRFGSLALLCSLLWIVVSCAAPPTRPSERAAAVDRAHAYAGLPRALNVGEVRRLDNTGFVVGYSDSRRNPLWVAYRIFRVADYQHLERPAGFRIDERTEARVSSDDYVRSGYDRGHMAPNFAIYSRYGREAQRQTFLMSNICPQRPPLNRRIWRELEQQIATAWANDFEEVWVITGPVFDSHIERLRSGVEIPDAFYKIVVDELHGRPRVLAFIVPQTVEGDEPAARFLRSIDAVENATGLDFLSDLPDPQEESLESAQPARMW